MPFNFHVYILKEIYFFWKAFPPKFALNVIIYVTLSDQKTKPTKILTRTVSNCFPTSLHHFLRNTKIEIQWRKNLEGPKTLKRITRSLNFLAVFEDAWKPPCCADFNQRVDLSLCGVQLCPDTATKPPSLFLSQHLHSDINANSCDMECEWHSWGFSLFFSLDGKTCPSKFPTAQGDLFSIFRWFYLKPERIHLTVI